MTAQIKTREELAAQDIETLRQLEEKHGIGNVHKVMTFEKLPCGKGVQTEWRIGSGEVVRSDYAVFVDEGVLAAGAAEL